MGEQSKTNNYKDSIKNLLLLNSLYPNSNFIEKSKIAIIFCYYKESKLDLALFHINRILKYNTYYNKIDYVYYLKGLIYYDMYIIWYLKYLPINYLNKDITYAKKSFLAFKYIINNYIDSKYILNSIERIIFL